MFTVCRQCPSLHAEGLSDAWLYGNSDSWLNNQKTSQEQQWNWRTWRQKLVPVPLCPLKIPHRLVWGKAKPLQWNKRGTSCLSHDKTYLQVQDCVRFEVLTAVLLRDSGLLRCDTVSLGQRFLIFQKIKLTSSLQVKHSLKMKASWSHEMSGTTQPPHSSTSHITCTLDYGAVYSLLSRLPPVH